MAPRLKEQYNTTFRHELKEEFGIGNLMDVPKLEKVVINMGVGEAKTDARLLEGAMADLAQITGQKASVCQARRSVSSFKLRKGMEIGCRVTLRGDRMYEFVDRLLNVAVPRIRDFRGLSPKSFDAQGNYTMGLREQTIFPEIDMDKVTSVQGMNITFVFRKSKSREHSRALLSKFGMPFRQ